MQSPYYHFGVRTSMPLSKVWTAGVQVVNGWNNVTAYNGGVTVGLTSSLVKPKYTWNFNYYTGPENGGLPPQYAGTQKGYRNLFDTTLLLTPNAKFNAYVNYDYGQNRIPSYPTEAYNGEGYTNVTIKSMDPHWQGIAASARQQITPNAALVFRYEYFYDNQGFATRLGLLLQRRTVPDDLRQDEYRGVHCNLRIQVDRRASGTRGIPHRLVQQEDLQLRQRCELRIRCTDQRRSEHRNRWPDRLFRPEALRFAGASPEDGGAAAILSILLGGVGNFTESSCPSVDNTS